MEVLTKISRKQEKAVMALISCPTITAAAEKAKVGETTIYRWMQDDSFKAHFRQARRDIVQQSMTQLQKATVEAVETLQQVMNDKDSPASARVTAASKILEFAVKAIELEDLEERIEALEKVIAERRE